MKKLLMILIAVFSTAIGVYGQSIDSLVARQKRKNDTCITNKVPPARIYAAQHGARLNEMVNLTQTTYDSLKYRMDSIAANIVAGGGLTDTASAIRKYVDSLYRQLDSMDMVLLELYADLGAQFDTSTAAQWSSINGKVPYANATSNVNLGEYWLRGGAFVFDTTPTVTPVNGTMYWDATNVTSQVQLNSNVTMQMGQEMYVRARNNTGVQINDGQVVYINDAQGNNPTIALANADSIGTSEVIGVATENIANNRTGFVTVFGNVNGINTSSYNDGDALYLSATNGQLTNVIPAAPHNTVFVGYALNSTVNGRIFVNPSRPLAQDTTMAWGSNKVAPTQKAAKTYIDNKVSLYVLKSDSTLYQPKYRSDTARTNLWPAINGKASTASLSSYLLKSDSTIFQPLYRSDTARNNIWPAINSKGSGTVTSVATGFGLSGGTIATSGTIIVDSTNLPTQYRVDTASRNARNVALGRVGSVSGTSGRISSTGGTTPVLDLVTVNATPGTYGGSSTVLQATVDAYGRATSITTVTPVTTTVITTTNFTTSYTIAATDSRPILITITAQAGDLLFNAPTGLTDGQLVLIRIKATGSSRSLAWNSAFGAITGPNAVALPTTVTTTAPATIQFIYNSTDNKLYLAGYVTN